MEEEKKTNWRGIVLVVLVVLSIFAGVIYVKNHQDKTNKGGPDILSVYDDIEESKLFELVYHISTPKDIDIKTMKIMIYDDEIHFEKDYVVGEDINKKLALSDNSKKELLRYIEVFDVFSLNEQYINEQCDDDVIETLSISVDNVNKNIYLHCASEIVVTDLKDKIMQFIGVG